jgi:hypothetical protein
MPNAADPLTYLTYILANARDKAVRLPTPDEFSTLSTVQAGRVAALFGNLE